MTVTEGMSWISRQVLWTRVMLPGLDSQRGYEFIVPYCAVQGDWETEAQDSGHQYGEVELLILFMEAPSWGKTARTQVYTNQGFNINTTSIEKMNNTHIPKPECQVVGTKGRFLTLWLSRPPNKNQQRQIKKNKCRFMLSCGKSVYVCAIHTTAKKTMGSCETLGLEEGKVPHHNLVKPELPPGVLGPCPSWEAVSGLG